MKKDILCVGIDIDDLNFHYAVFNRVNADIFEG